MRTLSYAVVTLGFTTLMAGCAYDRQQQYASADNPGFVTFQPADVTSPPAKITRFADENRDGIVTRDEAKADKALAAAFDRYDLDENDKLDRGEFARLEAGVRQRPAATSEASHQATQHPQQWIVDKPDGYFGPEPRSLNRTGGDQSRSGTGSY